MVGMDVVLTGCYACCRFFGDVFASCARRFCVPCCLSGRTGVAGDGPAGDAVAGLLAFFFTSPLLSLSPYLSNFRKPRR